MEANEPIRIAQIMGKWLGGGVESVIMNYYRNINKDKIQFDFICDEDSTNIPEEEIKRMGGRIIIVPPYQKIFKYHKALKKVLKQNKYSIVHSHINVLSVFSLFAAKCAGVPVRIAHSHSTTCAKEWKKNIIKQGLRPFSRVFATTYMACSETAGRWQFGNRAYKKGKVHIINNAIDIENFQLNDEIRKAKRKELKIDDDVLVIGHIGRFTEQKNQSFLIDVFNEIYSKRKDSMLIFVGQGPLENKMKEKVKALGLQNNVKFLGQIENVSEIYQIFDVFVFPSLYEGLGMVVIEAQCSGLPCVCSTGVPRTAKISNKVEFLNIESGVKRWSSKILEVCDEEKRCGLAEELSNHGYDIRKEAHTLVEKYEKMINTGRAIRWRER